MQQRAGQRAVVIGGSMAGLMSARVLADYFEQVTVVEKDAIEEGPALHKSIPQGNHYHALLLGGQNVLESLFPDFGARLRGRGATLLRAGRDVAFHLPGGKFYDGAGHSRVPRDLGFGSHSQSRGLLEQCVRELVRAIPNVELRTGASVGRLLFEGGRVKGVALQSGEREAELSAQLVVDAGGRASRTPRWLAENGFTQPEETTVGVDFAYASAQLRLQRTPEGGEKQLNGFGPPPNHPDGAIMGQIEGGLWHLSLAGRFGNYPPADREGFLGFTQRLYTPAFYDLIQDAEFAGEISSYRYPTSVWRRYERLKSFPEGLVVIGDAFSSFNPVYGQGMSSAALQVGELKEVLGGRARRQLGLDGIAPEFFVRAAGAITTPWILAALQDFAFPKTTGDRPEELAELRRYLGALFALSAEDPDVDLLVLQMFLLAKPLSALLAEPLRSRVLARL